MALINKHLTSYQACYAHMFCNAVFQLKGANLVAFSNDHNIVSSLLFRCQNKPPMEFLDPFLQMSTSEFRFRW